MHSTHSVAATAPCRLHPRRDRMSQQGSAYVITMLVLFALTVVGLGLIFITQTETAIGSQERTIERSFYAADAGVQAMTAAALNEPDACQAFNFTFGDVRNVLGSELVDRAETDNLSEIGDGPCNLCAINQGSQYSRVINATGATGIRAGADIANDGTITGPFLPVAEQSVDLMMDLQPRRRGIYCPELQDNNSAFTP